VKTIEEIKRILKEHKEELRDRFKVKEIGVFGSYVRGEQKRKGSDIDILVEFEEPIGFLNFWIWKNICQIYWERRLTSCRERL
jgi:predicted nucleotidyltransferase